MQHSEVITGYLQTAKKLWRQHTQGVSGRGARKVVLATMFIVVASLYINQIMMWRLFVPFEMETRYTGTVLTTLIAASAGVVYLWRMRIAYPIEITLVAIIAGHFLQQSLLPLLYSFQIESSGVAWYIIAYIVYSTVLLVSYLSSYVILTGWRARYVYKLGAVIGFVIIAIIIQTMLGVHGNE